MDSYQSVKRLHFFLRIFSLHCISRHTKGLKSDSWSHVKVTMILLVFGSLTSYNLYLHYTSDMMATVSPSVVVVDTINVILCYFVFIVDLYFVSKYRNEMCVYYYNFEKMDAVYNMKYNEGIKVSVLKLLFIFLPSWLVASVGQYCLWAYSGSLLSSTTYAASHFTFLIRILTSLDFISQTMHLRFRLKSITGHVEEIASFTDDSKDRVLYVRKSGKENKLPSISKCRCEISKASSCYLLLMEQEKFLNRFFGVRMLMQCLYTLTEMITFVNLAARVVSGGMTSVMRSPYLLAPNILKFINCVGILTTLVYYSEACVCECGNIVDAVDFFLVNKKTSHEIQISLKTLRKLVTSRPLKFTAAGFFNLESTLLLSIASVVITYALVLVQSTQ